MPTHTLNIIYDTNYTNIIKGWGFVDHQSFSTNTQQWWSTVEATNIKVESNQPQVTNQETEKTNSVQQQWQKTPWFFDLLFWPLNWANKKNNIQWNTQTNINQTQGQETQVQQTWVVPAASMNVNTWAIATWAIAAVNIQNQVPVQNIWQWETDESQKNVKKKSRLDSMLDNIFWTDDWSKKK